MVFEDPTVMPQVINWWSSNFDLDKVTYMHDIETTGKTVFPLVKAHFQVLLCFCQEKTKNSNQGKVKGLGKRGLLPWNFLRDQTIMQVLFVSTKAIELCFSHLMKPPFVFQHSLMD